MSSRNLGLLALAFSLSDSAAPAAFPKVIANETAFRDGTKRLVLYLSRTPARP